MKRGSWVDLVMDPTGAPGRASAAVVAAITAVVMVVRGTYAAAFVLLVIAVLFGFSAARYNRRHRGHAP